MENKIKDAQGNAIEIRKEDFVLCQEGKKISDKKFETKVTTFAKDAFKRFCKNKSSIVGAVIIMFLLLCSLLVPIISRSNISQVRIAEQFLLPKLFDAGTGFWDGTVVYNDITYNKDTQSPQDTTFVNSAIIKYLNVSEEGENFVNHYVDGAYGGKFIFGTSQLLLAGVNVDDLIARGYTQHRVSYNSSDNFKLNVKLANINDINDRKLGKYRFFIEGYDGEEQVIFYFMDWSSVYNEFTIDISAFLAQKGITEIQDGRIGFEVLPETNNYTYIAFDELVFTSSSTDAEVIEKLAAFSMRDANQKMGLQKDFAGEFPLGYWSCIGYKALYRVNIIKCSFIYDPYEAAYGDKIRNDLGGTEMQGYIDKGWCKYDFNIGPSSFVRISDKCPVVEVYSQRRIPVDGTYIYTFEAKVTLYKYYGYNSLPRYILGTDSNGFDIVKQVFYGLRLSFILSIAVSAICLSFGLVWGAISGYFGGNVDLLMERFCDILGSVPWIVVMTLILLHLGSNLFTFSIALCATGWMGIARRTRTQFYRFKGREYVLASRTLGASDNRLIFRHILPNAMGTIVTSAVLMIPGVIFRESNLAYLNLGPQGTNSLGNILANNQKYLGSFPALIVFPALILALIMISFNLFGNGLRDALNPSLKGSE